MPFHEGKVQRPPRQSDDGNIDELLLEEELEQRDAPVKRVLQHKDVDPRLMVAIDQIPVRVAQALIALDIPGLGLNAHEPARIARYPRRGDAVENGIDAPPDRGKRQRQLQQRDREQ